MLKQFITPRRVKNLAQKAAGFTLVELALIITIVSFVVINALIVGDTAGELNKEKLTRKKLERIEEAMWKHVMAYGFYPCPSDIEAITSNASFGDGAGSGTLTCTANNFAKDDMRLGGVPIRQLGLSLEDMMDAWGNRIMYAVSQQDTQLNNYKTTTKGNLRVLGDYDYTKNPLNLSDPSAVTTTDTASYVLLSFGPNGVGAWGYEGGNTRRPAPTLNGENIDSILEEINHHLYNTVGIGQFDRTFMKMNHPEIQDLGFNRFDDIVVFGEKHDPSNVTSGIYNDLAPESVPGLLMWFAPETIQNSGGVAPQWLDYTAVNATYANKISSMNNLAQDDAVQMRANSQPAVDSSLFGDKNVLRFDGVNNMDGDVMNVATTGTYNFKSVTVFVVARVDTVCEAGQPGCAPDQSHWQGLIQRSKLDGGRDGGFGLGMTCPFESRMGMWTRYIYHNEGDIPANHLTWPGCTDPNDYLGYPVPASPRNVVHQSLTTGQWRVFVGVLNTNEPAARQMRLFYECTQQANTDRGGNWLDMTATGDMGWLIGAIDNGNGDANWQSGSLKGRMAEVVVYDHGLSDFERERITRYLARKYNIAETCNPQRPNVASVCAGLQLIGQSDAGSPLNCCSGFSQGGKCCRTAAARNPANGLTLMRQVERCTRNSDCCGNKTCNIYGWCYPHP